jgi:hypothetical protein
MFDTKTQRFRTPHAEALAYIAALIAVEAPVQANKASATAKVSWKLVDDIREILTKAGFDWRMAAAAHKRIARERKSAARRTQLSQMED